MNEPKPALPLETGGTEITRFNALRHGVLSRYTVLPWEDPDEYRSLVAALVAEHAPQGPTEEHLVEELAGILWRKRRLRAPGSASLTAMTPLGWSRMAVGRPAVETAADSSTGCDMQAATRGVFRTPDSSKFN